MRLISTRYIVGNRGDLLSRYGILSALQDIGLAESTSVMISKLAHIEPLKYQTLGYGKLYNTLLNLKGWRTLLKSDVVIWTGGLDLSDDSSLLKLLYIYVNFLIYRLVGLKIYVLNQGAGPIKTNCGKALIKRILNKVDIFIARDSDSLLLLRSLSPLCTLELSYDGIFAGNLNINNPDSSMVNQIFEHRDCKFFIGFNIRKWFFFNSGILPVYMKLGKESADMNESMQMFTKAAISAIRDIRERFGCKVVLISAYEPNTSPEFDDLPLLNELKNSFFSDENVILIDYNLELSEYLYLISKLDLIIGTRLHTSLTALRLNVPAININYTLKGKSILKDMELSDLLIDLNEFIEKPSILLAKIESIINDSQVKVKIEASVSKAIQSNYMLYRDIFNSKL